MNKFNKTILAAAILLASATAGAVGVYEYENFTTSLDGEVGLTSSSEFRGFSISDQPTIWATIELLGTEGTLKGFYANAKGIGTNLGIQGVEMDGALGWKTTSDYGWIGDIGIIGKTFSAANDDIVINSVNIDYFEGYAKLGYTWDNKYLPTISYQFNYSDDYYNTFGNTMYHDVSGSVSFETSHNPVIAFAHWGYTDFSDNFTFTPDYSDFEVGLSTKFGDMETRLSATWMDKNNPFYFEDDNAVANLALSYKF